MVYTNPNYQTKIDEPIEYGASLALRGPYKVGDIIYGYVLRGHMLLTRNDNVSKIVVWTKVVGFRVKKLK